MPISSAGVVPFREYSSGGVWGGVVINDFDEILIWALLLWYSPTTVISVL